MRIILDVKKTRDGRLDLVVRDDPAGRDSVRERNFGTALLDLIRDQLNLVREESGNAFGIHIGKRTSIVEWMVQSIGRDEVNAAAVLVKRAVKSMRGKDGKPMAGVDADTLLDLLKAEALLETL